MDTNGSSERGALSVISDAQPELNGAAKKVAQYILNLPQETINLSITELSERVGVSEASIVRFAQALGYSGFHSLKIELASDIVSPMQLVHHDLGPDDGSASAVLKTMTAGMRSLEDTARIMDTDVLGAVIEALANARCIILLASGNSIPIALDLDFRLTKIGLHSRFAIEPTMQEMQANLATDKDVAVGISHTGSSKDTVRALDMAQKRGATTIGITNHSTSPLTRCSHICLFTSTRISHFRDEEMPSNLATLSLTEALYVGLSVHLSDVAAEAVTKTMWATGHRKY